MDIGLLYGIISIPGDVLECDGSERNIISVQSKKAQAITNI